MAILLKQGRQENINLMVVKNLERDQKKLVKWTKSQSGKFIHIGKKRFRVDSENKGNVEDLYFKGFRPNEYLDIRMISKI